MAIEVTGTFDIECWGWTHFLVGTSYHPARGRKVHTTAKSLLAELLTVGGTWWAHFGGGYDFLQLAELLREMGAKCQLDYSRGRCSRIVCGRLTLRDSYGLVPLALDVAASLADEKTPTFPWGCACERDCGGYCYLHAGMEGADMRVLTEYCARDTYILWRVLGALVEKCDQLDIELCGTIGQTAWVNAARILGLPPVSMPTQTWERANEGNYGGRNVVMRPECRPSGVHRDISSAYPAALAVAELPVGDPFELGSRDALLALNNDKPGIYEATVTVPGDAFLPPLPYRTPGGRVAYPTGTITGSWALPELLAAVARGTTVDTIHGAVVWDEARVLFAPLMERWYGFRRAAGKRTALGEWLRLLCNALTGMFSMSPLRQVLRMHPDEVKLCDRSKRCRDGCTGRCGAWEQVDAWGHIWAQPYFNLGESAHIHWAAYLRAQCRIAWLEGAEATGERELVYGATDSLWSTSREAPARTGSELGAWEYKHGFSEWECRGVGVYKYRGDDGKVVIRAAGLGKMTEAEWRAGKVRNRHGVLSLREAAQQGRSLFRRRDRMWALPSGNSGWFGDRLYGGSGLTYPASVHELHEREASHGRRKRQAQA